jgi:plastocyanin
MLALLTAAAAPAVVTAGGGGHQCGPTPAEAVEGGAVVNLSQNCFGPLVVEVAPGTTVTWRNIDSWAHAISGVGAEWGTDGFVDAGATFSQRFEDPGVYPYYCFLHPGMVGTVTVTEAGGPVSEAPESSSASVAPSLLSLLLGFAVGVVGAGGAVLARSRR